MLMRCILSVFLMCMFMFTGCINDNGIDEEIVLDGKYEGEGEKIAVDSKGNIYFTATYRGTINYGDKVLENEKIEYNENTYEETSYFLARLNNDGSQAWAIDHLGAVREYSCEPDYTCHEFPQERRASCHTCRCDSLHLGET